VQDFNPGGPSVSADFVRRLHAACPNFRYLKIEEPLSAAKIREMVEANSGEVGVLEGWGGLYMMELIPAGICGLMPGLALADVLGDVFRLRRRGEAADAFRLFERVLPQIEFSLQNLELFIHCEKRLLQRRGLLPTGVCRTPCYRPDRLTEQYLDELNERVIGLLKETGARI
jgi:4-hydroxy-tetrahydrodipicolinate synthase